jgi:hypothetical protein
MRPGGRAHPQDIQQPAPVPKKQGLKYEYLKNVLLEHKVIAPVPQKQGLKPKAASSTVIRD